MKRERFMKKIRPRKRVGGLRRAKRVVVPVGGSPTGTGGSPVPPRVGAASPVGKRAVKVFKTYGKAERVGVPAGQSPVPPAWVMLDELGCVVQRGASRDQLVAAVAASCRVAGGPKPSVPQAWKCIRRWGWRMKREASYFSGKSHLRPISNA